MDKKNKTPDYLADPGAMNISDDSNTGSAMITFLKSIIGNFIKGEFVDMFKISKPLILSSPITQLQSNAKFASNKEIWATLAFL